MDLNSVRLNQNQISSLKERIEIYQKKNEEIQVRLAQGEDLLVQREAEILLLRQKIEKYEEGSLFLSSF